MSTVPQRIQATYLPDNLGLRSKMTRDSARPGYHSRLPAPSLPHRGHQAEKEEQVREISELKKALSRTRQELQRTRDNNRSSSDEEAVCTKLSGSLSGSMHGLGSRSGSINSLSTKPSLNRELVSKLRSMTETIKMLSTENVALREENDTLLAHTNNERCEMERAQREGKLQSLVKSYEEQIRDLGNKIADLQSQLESTKSTEKSGEKDKYKNLARRLKEERNNYKEMVEEKRKEQEELKVEIEKMTEIIGDLRQNCGQLQDELISMQTDSPRRQERSAQTSPLLRRSSLSDISRRQMISPTKRSRSTMSAQSINRQRQISKSIELSRPKPGARAQIVVPPDSPGTSGKGPRIVKPVSRDSSRLSSPVKASTSAPPAVSSPRSLPSRIPSPSKIPTPSRSRPVKAETVTKMRVEERMSISHSDEDSSSSSGHSTRDSRQLVQLRITEDQEDYPPLQRTVDGEEEEEEDEDDGEFPSPPPPEHLAKLSMEAQFKIVSETVERACDRLKPMEPDTPRTTRKVENLKQKLAARRIQRTWKHFYQELEEKKAEEETTYSSLPALPSSIQEERRIREEEALAVVQGSVLGHERRLGGLSALRSTHSDSRARGGIYTARPWMIGEDTDESEDEDVQAVQGIVRSHSLRLSTITEGDVFCPGKVSSIRARFSRQSPDGASEEMRE